MIIEAVEVANELEQIRKDRLNSTRADDDYEDGYICGFDDGLIYAIELLREYS